MKYYYREHIQGYQRIKAEGKTSWGEIHGAAGFEDFSSRPFLEEVLPRLQFPTSHPSVLEYGCGTGPGACFLAERGFQVDGIDLIPTAIDLAQAIAAERGLKIHYAVQDIVELPVQGKRYDLIVDSFCLQCIVFDQDRQKVFSAVRGRLKAGGCYLVSTAMFDPLRFRAQELVLDQDTQAQFHRYGASDLIDVETGIVYSPIDQPEPGEAVILINDQSYLPTRRHRKPSELKAEMAAAGFTVLYQDDQYGGNLVCKVASDLAGGVEYRPWEEDMPDFPANPFLR